VESQLRSEERAIGNRGNRANNCPIVLEFQLNEDAYVPQMVTLLKTSRFFEGLHYVKKSVEPHGTAVIVSLEDSLLVAHYTEQPLQKVIVSMCFNSWDPQLLHYCLLSIFLTTLAPAYPNLFDSAKRNMLEINLPFAARLDKIDAVFANESFSLWRECFLLQPKVSSKLRKAKLVQSLSFL
jgi:hypothetical protein